MALKGRIVGRAAEWMMKAVLGASYVNGHAQDRNLQIIFAQSKTLGRPPGDYLPVLQDVTISAPHSQQSRLALALGCTSWAIVVAVLLRFLLLIRKLTPQLLICFAVHRHIHMVGELNQLGRKKYPPSFSSRAHERHRQ
jgi:hypothetical protein